MKIKKQTRKLVAGCSKHCFEVVDRTDEVSNHSYGKATLTWFEFDFRRVLFFLQVFILSYLFYYIFTKKAIVSFTIASFIIEPIRHYN